MIREIAAETGAVAVAFSADAHQLISAQGDGEIKVWHAGSGKLVRSIGKYPASSFPIALSRDGGVALTASGAFDLAEKQLKLWRTTIAQPSFTFKSTAGDVEEVALSNDGAWAASATFDGALKYWDGHNGRLIRPLEAAADGTRQLIFTPDGQMLVGTGDDGSVKIWNLKNGRVVADLFRGRDLNWLTILPQHGFFAGTPEGAEQLSIVRGLDVYDISQVYQSLFNPDLVSESLEGDPTGEVQKAAAVLDLNKVLDSGSAPQVAFGPLPTHEQTAELFTAETRITDRGGGIGRIEWRVNGVTAGVENPSGNIAAGSTITVRRTLALDAGENHIEALAYNGRNLLASLPARSMIKFSGPADSVKPRLHVLAIGINAYVDRGWMPPGDSKPKMFPRLKLAVNDAISVGAEMERAAAGLYDGVLVTTVLDKEATLENLDRIIDKVASQINPRDTFVLFAAAHGISSNGRFYLIPQDYQGGPNPIALARGAVGQDRLQDWIANCVKAKRAVILLDTCEFGRTRGRLYSVPRRCARVGGGRRTSA